MATTTTLLFPWSDPYIVKISIVDMQYKNLVELINELHQAMMMRSGKEILGKILSNLIRYTQAHF